MPVHKHDCPYCKYLGPDSPASGEPNCTLVDTYVCDHGDSIIVIRRYGSEPNNYSCVPVHLTSKEAERQRRIA